MGRRSSRNPNRGEGASIFPQELPQPLLGLVSPEAVGSVSTAKQVSGDVLVVLLEDGHLTALHQRLAVNTVGLYNAAQVGEQVIVVPSLHAEGHVVAALEFQIADLAEGGVAGNELSQSAEGAGEDWLISLVVSLALFATVIVAKLVGAILPIVAKLCRLDPAVVANPFITTIVDAVSVILFCYLSIGFLG